MKLLIRWIIASLALFVAAWLVPGIRVAGNAWIIYAVMAIILGLVNAIVRPLLKLLTCPLIIVTLGLFTLVINTLMLWLTVWLSGPLSLEGGMFQSFFTVFLGAIVISVVSTVLGWFLPDDRDSKKK